MTIALLTDFGPESVYVGQMKAVIAGIVPNFPLIDLTHAIAPGPPEDVIGEGAFLLERSHRYFPRSTIFVCVVDPGVGTDRRVLLAEVAQQMLVGPDNGVLAAAIDTVRDPVITHVTEERWYLPERSHTFHGRDVFAPLAAHLARGLRTNTLGPRLDADEIVRLPRAAPPGERGAVRLVDAFGNLVTDLEPRAGLDGLAAVTVGGAHEVTARARTFAEGPAEGPFFTIGGLGTIEVVCRGRSAARALGLGRGAVVEARYQDVHEKEAANTP